MKFNQKGLAPIAIILITAVVSLGVAGGGVWYWQNSEKNKQQQENQSKVFALGDAKKTLEKDKAELEQKVSSAEQKTTTGSEGINTSLTDKEKIILATLNRMKSGEGGRDWAVTNIKVEVKYAISIPIPVEYTGNSAPEIPGMGMATLIFEKNNGNWIYIAQKGEGGCDDTAKKIDKETSLFSCN